MKYLNWEKLGAINGVKVLVCIMLFANQSTKKDTVCKKMKTKAETVEQKDHRISGRCNAEVRGILGQD